ncbi:hypothetical protein Efla_007381 [Eimeria flavescens]
MRSSVTCRCDVNSSRRFAAKRAALCYAVRIAAFFDVVWIKELRDSGLQTLAFNATYTGNGIDVQQQARNALQPWDIADEVLLAYTCDYPGTAVASRDKDMKDV